MEKYDLRECFLPDLAGLHVRIYQFRELLKHNLPALSSHLEDLQVETAYVSQWFLSFFAVTCPLPMLFRIYDVIFAEGASETLMRVALSLMKKNEVRLLACAELEDVMQLLLSRGLWDCYHYDADEFVQDFVSITGIVTRERLSQLEQSYRESLIATASAARAADITTSATRFLGRIWNSSSAKTATLTPGTAASSRPLSLLRRSTSKQSLASTLNSMEVSSASVSSLASTEASTVSRDSSQGEDDSSRESTPLGSKTTTNPKVDDERYLHSQIEDLLTALSELQRNHALLSNQLQSEREEREEDRKAVRSLLDGLRKRATTGGDEHQPTEHPEDGEGQESEQLELAEEEVSDILGPQTDQTENAEVRAARVEDSDATPTAEEPDPTIAGSLDASGDGTPTTEDLSALLDRIERRFENKYRGSRSSLIQSKAQLRDELLSTKDQLASAVSHSQELSRQMHDMNQEISSLKEQLRDRHGHVRSLHQDKQRLEKQIHGMRARGSSTDSCHREAEQESAPSLSKNGGLRELKLGRSQSTPSQVGFGKRTSSMPAGSELVAAAIASGTATPPNEHEALLLELVQAKTAEAMAKQEAEEAKQKLEALRKAHGLPPSESASSLGPVSSVFGRLTGSASTTEVSVASTSANGGSFWGWRR